MKALITGASSGIGLEMAKYLADLGYDLIGVARNKEALNELKRIVKTNVDIYCYDLLIIDNTYQLYAKVKDEDIRIVINNAGYGLLGQYDEIKLEDELNMIDLNVKAVQILTKLFITKKQVKYILNVASSAGLTKGGPLMSTYYATKSYVCNYSLALYEELRRKKSDKVISILCPGPVDTNFNNRAKAIFNTKSMNKEYVAKYAIKKLFKKKLIIIPGFRVRMGMFLVRFIPTKVLLRIIYKTQERKKAS